MSQFPKDFLWGVACASFQCEGAWDEDGKGRNIWDDFCHQTDGVKNHDNGDVACDSYHRYKEDVALMVQHNIKAYRFSMSWARIIPDGDGEVNEKGFAFYDNLVDELLANGIEPLITLYHWDLPSALQDKGGWLNRDIIPAFARYALLVAKHFRGRVKKIMTLNEPQCIAQCGYESGVHAPGYKLPWEQVAKVYHILCLAHSAAQRAIKAELGDEMTVGAAICGNLCYPSVDTPAGREAAYKATFDLNRGWSFNIFLDSLILKRYDESAFPAIRNFAATIAPADWDLMEAPEFIGINVYQGSEVDEQGNDVPRYRGFPITAMDWDITPEVMHYGPMHLYKRYGLPMYITENGMANHDLVSLDGMVHDPQRILYLNSYLRELKKCIDEGVPVLGYLQWSFLDNFEWAEGYSRRFGMVYVDYRTCDRIPKDSARWYAKVIESNGETL